MGGHSQTVAVTDYTFDTLDTEKAILEPLGFTVVARRCKTPPEIIDLVAEADGVITQFAPVNADVITAMRRAKVIVRYGIGVDNVDLAAARARGIPVCNIPTYCIDEVADHTVALLLALTRQVVVHSDHIRHGNWGGATKLASMHALKELTVGIVGFGRIGREVASRLRAFKCKVLAADPMVAPADVERAGCTPVSLDELLRTADVVTLHCPSTPGTRRLIDRAALAKMKRGALLVHVARGDVVDSDALVAALRDGQLGGAALDVFDPEPIPAEHPLRAMSNVVITPHIASASVPAANSLRTSVANTVAQALRGEPLPNVVNGVGSSACQGQAAQRSPEGGTTNVSTRITAARLHDFSVTALTKVGVSEADARTTADVLVMTDTWGVFTHGVKALRGYVRRLRGGGLNPVARPRVVAEGPAWAIVDGQSALGMVTSAEAMRVAMAKARATGVGFVGVRNSCHFGAAGYYANLAAVENMIGLAMANDVPSVTAPGARGAVTGSNPLAYAVPAEPGKPLLLDMATSIVAGGKVAAAHALGKSIPDHWIVDRDGLPTTDPAAFLQGGALLPMAGHKGYGIALLIETLSGLLSGAALTRQIIPWIGGDPALATGHGAAFLAIDVAAFLPIESFRRRVAGLGAEIRQAPKARAAERIYLPGEIEWEKRDRALAEGVALPADVFASVRGLADDLALDLHPWFPCAEERNGGCDR